MKAYQATGTASADMPLRGTRHSSKHVAPRKRFFTAANLEKIATVVLILFISNVWFSSVVPRVPVTVFRLLGIGLALIVMWRYIPQMIATLISELPLTLLLIFCGVQVFWSIAPDHSIEPVLILYMTAFFGLYIGMRYSLEEQLSLIVWWVLLTWFLSFAFILLFPEHGIHTTEPHLGRWRGMFPQKNAFGIALTTGLVPLLALWRRWGIWRYILGGLILFTIFESGSATALATSVLMIAAVPLFGVFRMHSRLIVGAILILLPIAGVFALFSFFNADAILVALGRTPTLTGRTDLWEASFELIQMRPLHGWGLRGSFSPGSPIRDMIVWDAPYAHNHWIDTMLEVGLIGTFLYTLTLVRTLWRSFQYAAGFDKIEKLYPLVFLIVLHITLLSTQSLLTMFNSNWMFFVAIAYGLAIDRKLLSQMPYRRPYSIAE